MSFHNDFNLVQEPYYFKIQGKSFKLMHHPYYMSPDVDIVIYGHTHIPHVQFENKTLYINPGEVVARNRPSSQMMLLEMQSNQYIVKRFERTIGKKRWNEKKDVFYIDI